MKKIFGKRYLLSLILEGRKENASAMIVKKINDPALRGFLVHTILDNIIVADPTSNMKYIEWAARRMSEVARKEEDDRHILAMSQADEDPDGYMPGGPGDKVYTPERLKMIQGYTDEQRYQGGYLSNIERYLRHLDEAKTNIENRANVIVRNLRKYHKFAERNLLDKNIDKYKELYDWEHEVYKAEKEEQEREKMKQIEKGAKDTTDYLRDDDNYMIVRPRSADSSCYYGRGTKWCISATQSRNYFDQYTGEGTGFYFVLFKHLPQNDPYKKLALVFTVGDSEPSEVFDVADDEVGNDAIHEAARHNIFAMALKKSKTGQQIRKIKGQGRVESFKQAFNDVVEEYDDFMRTDSVEDKPSLIEVLSGLGLDEDDLKDENADLIQEHIEELTNDQHYEIVGEANGHFDENPAGPTDADFQTLYEQHKYDYLYVSYDEYDESRYYWDAGFSLDFTDIHEDLEDADADEVQEVVRKILDDYHTYPDEFDGYGTEISVRFSPDYDENEGLNGFENFLNRMDDVDQALHKMMESEKEDTLVAFKEAGLIAGATVKSLKERFDNLDLEHFEIDIEERDLSIYTRLNVTVPIPAHLYQGLTVGKPDWTQANRADINKSPQLVGYDKMLEKRQTVHSDALIDHIQNTFDKVFKLWADKLQGALPGFEREVPDRETTGLLIPDYNVSVYRSSFKTEVGASGILTPYFFDVRIETDEEESLDEPNLKLIELFLKTIDRKEMIEKIRNRFESIVQDDAIKNIAPHFKPDEDGPEWDPVTGKIVAPGEDDYKTKKTSDLLSTMFENRKRKSLRIIIGKSGRRK